MSLSSSTVHTIVDLSRNTRDFDYGVGDDLRDLERRVRRQIAAGIRKAAWLDGVTTQQERLAYEHAACIAESA